MTREMWVSYGHVPGRNRSRSSRDSLEAEERTLGKPTVVFQCVVELTSHLSCVSEVPLSPEIHPAFISVKCDSKKLI